MRIVNKGWRLDYFVVDSSLMNAKSKYHVTDSLIHDDVMGSDHCPVSIKLVAVPA